MKITHCKVTFSVVIFPKKKGNQIHEYLWIITINLFDWLQLLAEANLMWEAWLHTARISTGLDTPVSKYHTVFSINAQWLCNWVKPKLPKRHKWKLEEDLYNQNHFIITLRNQPPGAGGALKHEVPDSNNLTHLNYWPHQNTCVHLCIYHYMETWNYNHTSKPTCSDWQIDKSVHRPSSDSTLLMQLLAFWRTLWNLW